MIRNYGGVQGSSSRRVFSRRPRNGASSSRWHEMSSAHRTRGDEVREVRLVGRAARATTASRRTCGASSTASATTCSRNYYCPTLRCSGAMRLKRNRGGGVFLWRGLRAALRLEDYPRRDGCRPERRARVSVCGAVPVRQGRAPVQVAFRNSGVATARRRCPCRARRLRVMSGGRATSATRPRAWKRFDRLAKSPRGGAGLEPSGERRSVTLRATKPERALPREPRRRGPSEGAGRGRWAAAPPAAAVPPDRFLMVERSARIPRRSPRVAARRRAVSATVRCQ